MPVSRGRKKAKKARPKLRPLPRPKKSAVPWKAIVSGAATIAGLILAIVAFWPRLSVDADGPIDPLEPASIAFTIKNENFYPLYDVQPYIALCEVGADPIGGRCNIDVMPKFFLWAPRKLSGDEKWTIFLDDLFRERNAYHFAGADMGIGVRFHPWGIAQIEKIFRFVTHPLNDGKFYWRSIPAKEDVVAP